MPTFQFASGIKFFTREKGYGERYFLPANSDHTNLDLPTYLRFRCLVISRFWIGANLESNVFQKFRPLFADSKFKICLKLPAIRFDIYDRANPQGQMQTLMAAVQNQIGMQTIVATRIVINISMNFKYYDCEGHWKFLEMLFVFLIEKCSSLRDCNNVKYKFPELIFGYFQN